MLIGMIAPYAGPINARTKKELEDLGWLHCDGSEVPRAMYKPLHAVVGESWGEGDNVSTFNLPDLRGYFMRGVDHGSKHDPEADSRTGIENRGGNTGDAVGSYQSDSVGPHTHQYAGTKKDTNTWKGGGDASGGYVVRDEERKTQPSSGQETRSKNVYVDFLIRYKL